MALLFKLEEEVYTYYPELTTQKDALPLKLVDLINQWEDAIAKTHSLRNNPYYIIFEGSLEPVYTDEDYLQARSTEMELWCNICDMANEYKMNEVIYDLVRI